MIDRIVKYLDDKSKEHVGKILDKVIATTILTQNIGYGQGISNVKQLFPVTFYVIEDGKGNLDHIRSDKVFYVFPETTTKIEENEL